MLKLTPPIKTHPANLKFHSGTPVVVLRGNGGAAVTSLFTVAVTCETIITVIIKKSKKRGDSGRSVDRVVSCKKNHSGGRVCKLLKSGCWLRFLQKADNKLGESTRRS